MRTKTLFLFLCLFTALACNEGGGSKRRSSQDTTGESKKGASSPDSLGPRNILFSQDKSSESTLVFNINFSDSFGIKGDQVHSYISTQISNTVHCLIVPFAQSNVKKVLILRASPFSVDKPGAGTKEYRYAFSPAEQTQNSGSCNTSGVLSYVSTNYSGYGTSFYFEGLCSSCSQTGVRSSSVQLLTTSGDKVSSIETNYLTLTLNFTVTPNDSPYKSCQKDSDCSSDYDCCTGDGVCANDGQKRPDTKLAYNCLQNAEHSTATYKDCMPNEDFASYQIVFAAYGQMFQDVENDCKQYKQYGDYYYVCPNKPPSCTSTDPSEEDKTKLSQEELKDLYNCTHPTVGEMSICTISFEDASKYTSNIFSVNNDDLNFSTTYTGTAGLSTNTIYEIVHAGETIYNEDSTTLNAANGTLGAGNDNLTSAQTFTLTHSKGIDATDDILKIRYKVDGSCEYRSSTLASCTKYYVQAQNSGLVTDHSPSSTVFKLPDYADMTKTIKVTVDGQKKYLNSHWTKAAGSPNTITFLAASTPTDGANIAITFYVNTSTYPVLNALTSAKTLINQYCQADSKGATLEYVTGQTSLYRCKFGGADEDVTWPESIEAKNVPWRYFATTGTNYDTLSTSTPTQEGTAFSYSDGVSSGLFPNNTATTIGFHELYGSLGIGTGYSRPPVYVAVEYGKEYDIWVANGTYSSCTNCGVDYFSQLAQIFPSINNSLNGGGGGGMIPNGTQANPFKAKAIGRDRFLFGRACFVPATMIPWTHSAQATTQTQRLNREQAQHFLFANGYYRDWYGFDYGSIIGSFDGIKWFSVGSARRVKATSSKLYLAVNAYFGDLASGGYKLEISESSTTPGSGPIADNDYESTGAQCQQFHLCETDEDCFRQLGPDYACENVGGVKTNWPVFDVDANEQANSSTTIRLVELFNTLGGKTNRCVYRGRGAPCIRDYSESDTTLTYTHTNLATHHMCSANNYCEGFFNGNAVFNTKIARWAQNIEAINDNASTPLSTAHTFGLGAPHLGTPYNYNGTEDIDATVRSTLGDNRVEALCLPGKNTGDASKTFADQHDDSPDNTVLDDGDMANNLGMTPDNNLATYLYSSCPTFSTSYELYSLSNSTVSLGDAAYRYLAGTQNMSTKALEIFEDSFVVDDDLVSDYSSQVTEPILQKNRCLRAPGASCFSDAECAPSKTLISDKILTVDPDDTNNWTTLNKYEIQFWQEGLICAQKARATDTDYDLSKNRCCREVGKTISVGTLAIDSTGAAVGGSYPSFDNSSLPGTEISLASASRYSRIAPAYYSMKTDSTSAPALAFAGSDACGTACVSPTTAGLDMQWRTLGKILDPTSCSKNWIREFHDDLGGGHDWNTNKTLQIPEFSSFQCHNWNTCTAGVDCGGGTTGTTSDFNCALSSDPADVTCRIRNFPFDPGNPDAKLKWFAKLELMGIPQIKIPYDVAALFCNVSPTDQSAAGTTVSPLTLTGTREYSDGNEYWSTYDSNNIDSSGPIKMIFSADTFASCYPTGTQLLTTESKDLCCTGHKDSNNICGLPDYASVSVYYNRFVSSELQDKPDSVFDEETGYINDRSLVAEYACEKKACNSGVLMYGVAISKLNVPGKESSHPNYYVSRFIDGEDSANNVSEVATFFKNGVKWNHHVYCAPASLATTKDTVGNLQIKKCN